MNQQNPIIRIFDPNISTQPYSFTATPKFNSIQIQQAVQQQKRIRNWSINQKTEQYNTYKQQKDNNAIKIPNRQYYKNHKMLQKYQKLIINSSSYKSSIKQTQSVRSIGSTQSKKSKNHKRDQILNYLYSKKNAKNSRSSHNFNTSFANSRACEVKSIYFSPKNKIKPIKRSQQIQDAQLKKNYKIFIDNSITKSSLNLIKEGQSYSKGKIFRQGNYTSQRKEKRQIPQQIQLFYSSSSKKQNQIREKGKSIQSLFKKARPAMKIKGRVLNTKNLQKLLNSQLQETFIQY